MEDTRPWYEQAFGPEYLRLYQHRSPAQGRQQVAQMLTAGLLPRSGRVLDLCCGAGRHLLPMREAGLAAVGLDLSLPLLGAGGLGGVAVRGNALRLPFAGDTFACVTNLFSSFGYFDSDAAQAAVLSEIRRVLQPCGRLVLDVPNAGPTVAALVPESREERDGLRLVQRRQFDAATGRITKHVEYQAEGLPARRWHESLRVYAPAELDALLAAAGLKTRARHGDLDGSAFELSTSLRQVVVAERPDSA
ncbi:MAG: class I SAM-dependent methyltransferase [Planctomycetes bacterium]|nr:class I SAM-dependent methyltransferase [Planctomycetota bacterium]